MNRVAVIGAGISGLVAAKVLRADGFDVTIFEKLAEVGGVWASPRTYPELRTNNSRLTYAYSDFPYPTAANLFPTAPEVRGYLNAYVRRFSLGPLLRLATEVIDVALPAPDGPFRLRVRANGTRNSDHGREFEYVVVGNGVFSQPNMPAIAGADRFPGQVLHSSEFTDASLVQDHDVIVVGGGKSAVDCAAAAAATARSCRMLFRAPHRMLPRYTRSGAAIDRLLLSRASELMLPPYHRGARVNTLLYDHAAPLIRAWWRRQGRTIDRLLDIPELQPDLPLPYGLENVGIVSGLRDHVRAGRLSFERGSIKRFTAEGTAILANDHALPADVVIFATGWHQDVAFLDASLRERVLRDGVFQLFRHVLPPEIPRLGFIGYATSIASQLTAEIAAHWLADVFLGELRLPTAAQMYDDIARVHAWSAAVFPTRSSGYVVGPYVAHYIDQLMQDMRLPTQRTRTVREEYFEPLWPTRYQGVADERRQRRRRVANRAALV